MSKAKNPRVFGFVVAFLAIVLFVPALAAGGMRGDLDGDGQVCRTDLNIILSHRNQPASVCPECDLDGDGIITALDARKLVLLCTRPRCVCVEVEPNAPPAANAGDDQTHTLSAGQTEMTVTLDGSASSDEDGQIVSYAWSGPPDPNDEAQPAITLSAGTYNFSLVVTDDDGAMSASDDVIVTILINQPPEGKIEPAGSITIYAGQSISFTGVATDPDDTISDFLWDFGGGAPDINVQNPADILFNTPGTYTVTFTPIDDAGLPDPDPDTVVVTVLSPMPAGIDPTIGFMVHFLDHDGDGTLDADALSKLADINDPQFIDVDANGGIQLILTLSNDLTQDNEDSLTALGIEIELRNSARRIQVRVPLGQMANLSALPFVEFVSLPSYAVYGMGSIMTQGDAVLASDQVRNVFGLDGTGVKVGVISDGLRGLSDSQATGDLPAVKYKSFRSDGNIASGSEGTAMLEIVHDIAPGAELYFCNGGTHEGFIAAVDYMAREDDPTTADVVEGLGLDIIIDDLGFFVVGPYDGTSTVSEAASEAVTLHGARYFTISHNFAEKHYRGQFRDTDDNGIHDFNTSTIEGATKEDFVFALPASSSVKVWIMWDDPDFNHANSDFHPTLRRYNPASKTFDSLCLGGEIDNNDLYILVSILAQLPELPRYTNMHRYPYPREFVIIENKTDTAMGFSLRLQKMGGPDEARNFDIFFVREAILETFTPEGSVPNLGDAKNVISVGAVPWFSPNEREDYSGYGPTWDGRQKPEVVATDMVCITGSGEFGYSPDDFPEISCQGNVFPGTSAASPHAGAVAALMLQANPSLSHDEIKQTLQQTAVDIEAPGVDQTSGYGRINAYAAVQTVLAASPTLQSVDITNADLSFTQAGATQQLTVIGHYSDGSEQNLTTAATGTTFESSDTQVATVSSGGLVTAVATGVTTITAINSGISDTVQVTVSIPVVPTLQSIEITNGNLSFTEAGVIEHLNVIGHYSDGSQQDLTASDTDTTYQSSNPQVATVSSEGVVTAIGNGVATITATNSGNSDSVGVTVSITVVPTLQSIDITNSDITLTEAGTTQQLAVTGHYSDGSQQDLSSAANGTTYVSSDTSVATVSADGMVTAVADGTTTITATNSGFDDTVQVSVSLLPAPTAYIWTVMSDVIDHGDLSRICWECENATRAVIEPGNNTNAISTGCMRVYPGETTTYTITASGPGGTNTSGTTIEVNPPGALSLELMGQIGGVCNTVAVSENYAYVGIGPSLHILDITNPAEPVPMGKVLLHELVGSVAVSGRRAYVLDGIGMHIINATDPTAPYVEGSVVGIQNARDIAVVGDYAYVPGWSSGLIIIDVSNPANPVPISEYLYSDHWVASGLDISGSNAYVTGGYTHSSYGNPGIWIIDVSNPQTPVYTSNYEISNFEDVTVSGDYAYIAAVNDGVLVLDVSNPSEPVYVGSMNTSCAVKIVVSNGHVYVADENGGLVIMPDNPENLTIENTFETIDDAKDIAISGFYGFIACEDAGMQVIDLTNPSAPETLAWYQTSSYPRNMFAANPYCYVADLNSGLYVVDATDPTDPVRQYCDGETWSASDVVARGNYAYVASSSDGLVVVDISDPLNMRVETNYAIYNTAWGIDVSGDLAFLATNWSDLVVFDIADPLNAVATGQVRTYGIDYNVSVSGNYAYVAKGSAGMSVINATDPYYPVEELNMNTIYCNDVEVYGGYAYVAANHQGLLVYNLTSPVSPVQVGQYDQGSGKARNIAVSRGFAYVACEYDGLRVVNVNDPQNPQPSDIYKSGGWIKSVAVDGRYVYVSSDSGGVSVLRTHLKPADIMLPSSGNVRVRFVSKSASYDNEFHLLSPTSRLIFEAVNANVGNTYELGSYTSGDVLEFGLHTPKGHTFSTDHDSNFDECIHVIVTQIATTTWRFRWEDGNFLGDEDFNDVVVDVELY